LSMAAGRLPNLSTKVSIKGPDRSQADNREGAVNCASHCTGDVYSRDLFACFYPNIAGISHNARTGAPSQQERLAALHTGQ
jgi:hypothetical protein